MLSSLKAAFPPAILALADGTVFIGNSIGSIGTTVGEVVFNTAMTGYQEILTDPSYCQQIVTLTYPHIGNYGVNDEDMESAKVQAAGLVIRDLPLVASNFRAQQTLPEFLNAQGTVAIANVDTRKLTRLLREKGAQNGAIVGLAAGESVTPERIAAAVAAAQKAPSMSGLDLAKVVSTPKSYDWDQTEWALGKGFGRAEAPRFHVVAYDFGVKRNILRMLAERGCKLTVVPAQTTAQEALALKPDGIFLSNGPGDPEPCTYAYRGHARLPGGRHSALRHLPGPPDHGAGPGRADLQDAPWPPWRQPPREDPGQRPRVHHQPEPRLRRRGGHAAGQRARHPRQPVRRHAAGPGVHPTNPPSASRATPRLHPARTT
ncbi:carbamoyl-phosphate synthase small chain protein [Alicycliphilus sp. B1]|nr:carbamoyl-phosphate synthase small chain protein [Alicycliphilus sp. B1]